jgi:hypothetical protein
MNEGRLMEMVPRQIGTARDGVTRQRSETAQTHAVQTLNGWSA